MYAAILGADRSPARFARQLQSSVLSLFTNDKESIYPDLIGSARTQWILAQGMRISTDPFLGCYIWLRLVAPAGLLLKTTMAGELDSLEALQRMNCSGSDRLSVFGHQNLRSHMDTA